MVQKSCKQFFQLGSLTSLFTGFYTYVQTVVCLGISSHEAWPLKDPVPSPLAPGIQAPGASDTKQVRGKRVKQFFL